MLGIYVSGHPLEAHLPQGKKPALSILKIKEEKQQGMPVNLPVLITVARSILTKSGEKMAFLTVEDMTDSIEAVVFPKLFKMHASALVSGTCLLAKGKVAIRSGELSLALDDLKVL